MEKTLRNPVWETSDHLCDPMVVRVEESLYKLYYTRLSNRQPDRRENWAVAAVYTRDFIEFHGDHDVTPKGFASPGDVVRWHDRWILPYHSFPEHPARLHFSESRNGKHWSDPQPFLDEAADLPWNRAEHVIDPTLVFLPGGSGPPTLHCWFVGTGAGHGDVDANLLGHAFTVDPDLRFWEITTRDRPLIGPSETAPDGVENVTVFPAEDGWRMIYTEGLAEPRLAAARSEDLLTWTPLGRLDLPRQSWMAARYGAPCVWEEGDTYRMILMGEATDGISRFGLLESADGLSWTPLPESP
ncbi:MAG: hypothetical protein SFU56_09180 [Capsulimonadales bacterium]|nr:hypothetical protein [Capsulimonadales bacterium]